MCIYDLISINIVCLGEYNVVVKFADKHIPGSPFNAEIFPKGADLGSLKRERPVVGKPCDVKLDIPDIDLERDFDDLTGTLKRPGSDKEEPVELSKNPDGTVGVTFTPYEPGVLPIICGGHSCLNLADTKLNLFSTNERVG